MGGERREHLVLLRRRNLELVERLREDAGDGIEFVRSDVEVAVRFFAGAFFAGGIPGDRRIST